MGKTWLVGFHLVVFQMQGTRFQTLVGIPTQAESQTQVVLQTQMCSVAAARADVFSDFSNNSLNT
jgi:hypothetical protein